MTEKAKVNLDEIRKWIERGRLTCLEAGDEKTSPRNDHKDTAGQCSEDSSLYMSSKELFDAFDRETLGLLNPDESEDALFKFNDRLAE